MLSGKKDIIKKRILQNDFSQVSELKLHNYRWMPSLKIHLNAMREEIDFMPQIMVDYL